MNSITQPSHRFAQDEPFPGTPILIPWAITVCILWTLGARLIWKFGR